MQYIIAGLVLGGIYGVVAAGLVITYASAGVLNLAFGSEAYFIARFYYFLHTQHNWGIIPAAVVSILIVGPMLGVLLYFLLFKFLQFASTLVKIIATVGLSVSLPPIAAVLFSNISIGYAPGLAPIPVHEYQIFGTGVSLDQVNILVSLLVILIAGILIVRFTDIGLAMRGMVDSPALSSVMGSNPGAIALTVWTASTFLAGLIGVLVGPIVGLASSNSFTLLMVSALAAVVAAKLRYVGRAVVVGLLLGVLGGLIQRYVPPESIWASASVTSVPFVVTMGFVIYYGSTGQARSVGAAGGSLDEAITFDKTPQSVLSSGGAVTHPTTAKSLGSPASRGLLSGVREHKVMSFATLVVIALPFIVSGFWVGVIALGFAYGVLLLSNTVMIGEGGLISLCQITFAGIGGVATAQLATVHHWPVLPAMLIGGLISVPVGLILGAASLLLGDVYFALVTLSFGVLMDNLVFTLNTFSQYGTGVALNRPEFASADRPFAYLCLAVFGIVALFTLNLRRSTTGLGVAAVRWSEPGARTLGLSVVRLKASLTGVAVFIAGVAGGLLAMSSGYANPAGFVTLIGLVWLCVTATFGIRSIYSALLGGLALAVIPAVFVNYLPVSVAQIPTGLFGIGAMILVRNPEGVLSMNKRHAASIRNWITSKRSVKNETSAPPPRSSEMESFAVRASAPDADGSQ